MQFYDTLEAYRKEQRERLEQLKEFPMVGIIRNCYLPLQSSGQRYSLTSPVEELLIDSRGIHHDRHRRIARVRSGREKGLYGRIDGEKPVILEQRHILAMS